MADTLKIFALDLRNATIENLENWFITTNYITADCTKDFIRYRVKDDQNEIQLIFIINDIFFGTVTKLEYPNIVINSWFTDEFVKYCIPIKLNEIELYRSVIIDWIFNCHTTRAKTAFELLQLQKYNADFDEMLFPHFTSCVTCIDVEELGFTLGEFFMPLNQKFKAIYSEFRQYYPKTKFLKEVKLTKIYILEKYILGYSFRLANEPYEHFFYNIHFEDLMYQLTAFKFDEVIPLSIDRVLDKIAANGMASLSTEEQNFLNYQ
jgi:hypothetical protein